MLGQGRGKDQCNDPRNQTTIEFHANPRTTQRDAGDKVDAGIAYQCTNIET
jgi:hypothetical protein